MDEQIITYLYCSDDICPLNMGAYRMNIVLIMLYKKIHIYKPSLKPMLDYCYSFSLFIYRLKAYHIKHYFNMINKFILGLILTQNRDISYWFLLTLWKPIINLMYFKMSTLLITITINIPHGVVSTSNGSAVPFVGYGKSAL